MKPLVTTKIYIDQCLCVVWLWGQVFVKVMAIFKTELHRHLLLIRYQKYKSYYRWWYYEDGFFRNLKTYSVLRYEYVI